MNQTTYPSWMQAPAAPANTPSWMQAKPPAPEGPPRIAPPQDLHPALEALRHEKVWLLWKYGDKNKNGKYKKIPVYANGSNRNGPLDSPEDRAQLVTFDSALEACKLRWLFKDFGLGLALGPLGDGRFVQGVDLDGVGEKGTQHLVDDAPGVIEVSPSGKGYHAIGIGPRFDTLDANDSGIEAYAEKRFFTFTNNIVGGKLADLSPYVELDLVPLHGGSKGTSTTSKAAGSASKATGTVSLDRVVKALKFVAPPKGYGEWFKLICAIKHALGDSGREVARQWSAQDPEKYTEKGFNDAWNSGKADHKNPVTAATLFNLAHAAGMPHEPPDVKGQFPNLTGTAATAGAGHRNRFEAEFLDDVSTAEAIPDELVQGLILSESVTMIDGPSNSGKTFTIVAMSAAVQQGTDFMGHRVQQGQVVYVAAESPGSIKTRALAHKLHHGKSAGFALIPATPDLFANDDDLNGLIEGVRSIEQQRGKVRLIVIDTLASVSGAANENTSEMATVMRRIERLKAELKTCVCIVHHTGKNTTAGARGWSGIRASVDTEIEVSAEGDARTMTFTKQRDLGSKGKVLSFTLRPVTLGITNFGEVSTSCVALPVSAAVTAATSKKDFTKQWAVREHIEGLARRGTFMTITELRSLSVPGIKGVRGIVEGLVVDGTLIERTVDGVLVDRKTSKRCLFSSTLMPAKLMLDHAERLARESTIADPERLEAVMNTLRQEIGQQGEPRGLPDFFKPAQTGTDSGISGKKGFAGVPETQTPTQPPYQTGVEVGR